VSISISNILLTFQKTHKHNRQTTNRQTTNEQQNRQQDSEYGQTQQHTCLEIYVSKVLCLLLAQEIFSKNSPTLSECTKSGKAFSFSLFVV
jgi:hypothetical protein